MNPWAGLAAAAALAVAITAWWYGRREEKVRGRVPAAVLRGVALFLILAAPWLPGLRDRHDDTPRTAILLDSSLSMRLPVSGSEPTSRMEAARDSVAELKRRHRGAPVWGFAATVTALDEGAIGSLEPDGLDSRVVDAIERARAAGADTLIVVTDGGLTDREAGRRMAARLAVAVTEVRVAESVDRVGILDVAAPRMVTAGDSFEVRAEIVSSGTPGDSVRVSLSFGAGSPRATVVETPAPGRSTEAVFQVFADPAPDSVPWRPLDVRLEGWDPPWDPGTRSRVWIAVSPEPTGAVLVSLDPGWESRYLLPVLERSTPGGARAFIQIGDDVFVRAGRRPRGEVKESQVRRAAASATLLVIHGDPGDLPPWLEAIASRRPSVLHLATGPGPVAGSGITVTDLVPGEWYPETPPPSGPVSASLLGADAGNLPPLTRLRGLGGSAGAPVLTGRRDRRGPRLPVAVSGAVENRRWAVVSGEGTWRWAARGGRGLELYRGLYSGLTRWLIERTALQPAQPAALHSRAGDPMRWRVAPRVRDLALRWLSATGEVVWVDTIASPGAEVTGPVLAPGETFFSATGEVSGTAFRVDGPLHGNSFREELPRSVGEPLLTSPGSPEGHPPVPDRQPPVWPFAAATALLCAEWLLRRRVGLR